MLSAEHHASGHRPLRRRLLIGTTGAAAGVAVCFLVAAGTGAQLLVAVGDTDAVAVPFGAAVFATVAAGAAAYVIARLSQRMSRPRRTYVVTTVAGLLLSAVPPLQAAVDASTAIWLLLMHIVAALALIPTVAGSLPVRRAKRRVGASSVGRVPRRPVGTPGQP